jgi:hypothetical protein
MTMLRPDWQDKAGPTGHAFKWEFHAIHEHIKDGMLGIMCVRTADNIADIFIKPLGRSDFLGLRF